MSHESAVQVPDNHFSVLEEKFPDRAPEQSYEMSQPELRNFELKEHRLRINAAVVERPKHGMHSDIESKDTFVADPTSGVIGVFDGTGGHEDGRFAAELAAKSFIDYFSDPDTQKQLDSPRATEESVKAVMARGIETARAAVIERSNGGGTTACLGKIVTIGEQPYFAVMNAGDSRLFQSLSGSRPDDVVQQRAIREHTGYSGTLHKPDILYQVTDDQSAGSMVSNGLGPKKRRMGDVPDEIILVPLKSGQRYIFTTDGVTGDWGERNIDGKKLPDQYLSVYDLQLTFAQKTPSEAAQRLITQSLDHKVDDDRLVVAFDVVRTGILPRRQKPGNTGEKVEPLARFIAGPTNAEKKLAARIEAAFGGDKKQNDELNKTGRELAVAAAKEFVANKDSIAARAAMIRRQEFVAALRKAGVDRMHAVHHLDQQELTRRQEMFDAHQNALFEAAVADAELVASGTHHFNRRNELVENKSFSARLKELIPARRERQASEPGRLTRLKHRIGRIGVKNEVPEPVLHNPSASEPSEAWFDDAEGFQPAPGMVEYVVDTNTPTFAGRLAKVVKSARSKLDDVTLQLTKPLSYIQTWQAREGMAQYDEHKFIDVDRRENVRKQKAAWALAFGLVGMYAVTRFMHGADIHAHGFGLPNHVPDLSGGPSDGDNRGSGGGRDGSHGGGNGDHGNGLNQDTHRTPGHVDLRQGGNPWDSASNALHPGASVEDIDRVKDEILRMNNLSEQQATQLPVGYRLHMPVELIEELNKKKK